MKRALPWLVVAIFAVAFVVVLVAKRGGGPNEIDGVTARITHGDAQSARLCLVRGE